MPTPQQLRERRRRLRQEAKVLGERRRKAQAGTQPYAPPQRDPSQWEDTQSTLERRDVEMGYGENISELDKMRARQQEDVARGELISRENEAQDVKATRQRGNEAGLLFSGVLGKQVGDVSKRYGTEREGTQRSLQRSLADIEERRGQLGQRRQLALDQVRMYATQRGVAAAQEESLNAPAFTQSAVDKAAVTRLNRRIGSRETRIGNINTRINQGKKRRYR